MLNFIKPLDLPYM